LASSESFSSTSFRKTRRNTGEIILRGRIYYIRYYDNRGRRRLETTKSTDKAEAERLLRQRLSAKDAGVDGEAAVGKLVLKDALADVENDYRTNGKKSLGDVQRKIRLHLLPFFGEKRKMTSITTSHLRAFIAERQREEKTGAGKVTKRAASAAEINRELATLRRAFNLAVQAGRLVSRPHFPMLKERNVRRGFLEAAQVTAICAALPAPLRPIVKFAFATGWRTQSEVLPMEWRQVDWAGRCVRLDVGTTKNGEGRVFPFTTEIETILTGQLAEHERMKKVEKKVVPQVFHRNGKPIAHFRTAWEAACTEAGCPGKLIHDLRRSAVRTFERAGVPRSVAMSIVGHKTESIYRRYAIVDEAMQREAAARLDAFMSAPQPAKKTGTVRPFRPKAGRGAKLRAPATA
jgi:integrase